jgi:hypothetical protein
VFDAANPGEFKDEHKWHEWELAFGNYLSAIPGVNGILLLYVIHKEAEPHDGEEYISFTEHMIFCAPHTRPYYLVDLRRVHNLITGMSIA